MRSITFEIIYRLDIACGEQEIGIGDLDVRDEYWSAGNENLQQMYSGTWYTSGGFSDELSETK